MIKRKNKKFARFLALLGVMVILAVSLLATVSSASTSWQYTDIPFYNYWNTDAFPPHDPNTETYGQGYIVSTDQDSGIITMGMVYHGVGQYYAPYQFHGLKLRDICPEMKAGEKYYLNGEYLFPSLEQQGTGINCIALANNGDTYWYFGTTKYITEADLDSYVYFFAGNFTQAGYQPEMGEYITRDLRIWINKDASYSFCPYHYFESKLDNAYDKGLSDGYDGGYQDGISDGYDSGYTDGADDGYANGVDEGYIMGKQDGYEEGRSVGYADGYDRGLSEYITDNLLVSSKSISVMPVYINYSQLDANGQYPFVYGTRYRNVEDYPYNGYTFRTSLLPDYYWANDAGVGYKLCGYEITCITKQFGQYFVVGNSPLSISGKNITMLVRLRTVGMAEGELKEKTYVFSEDEFQTIDIDFASDFGLADTDQIMSISFYGETILARNPYSSFYGFSFAFANQDGYSFQVGFKEGQQIGYEEGKDVGYEYGTADGKKEGYASGKADGIVIGKEEGLAEGKAIGFEEGYDEGFYYGEIKGLDEGSRDLPLTNLIYATVDAPLSVVQRFLNFEILNVNIAAFVASLITLCLVIKVVGKLV